MGQASRIQQIQSAMAEQGVDAVVLRLAENVLLATGWYTQIPGLTFVVVGAGGATLMLPDYEVDEAAEIWSGDIRSFPAIRNDGPPTGEVILGHLRDLAAEHGAAGGVVGYEGSFESIAPASIHGEPNAVALPTQALIKAGFATERLHDITETLETIRSVKTEHDLELIRRTNEIAIFGLNAFKEYSVPGNTEIEVVAAVERAITLHGHGYQGARWVRGFATVYSGPDLAEGWKYWRARTRRIEPGDAVMLELGTGADGYWSDHTRTVIAGKASPRMREAYAAVQAAVSAGFAAAVPGATGGEVDAASRAACRRPAHASPSSHRSRNRLSLPRVAPAAGAGWFRRAGCRQRDHHRAGHLQRRARRRRPSRGQRRCNSRGRSGSRDDDLRFRARLGKRAPCTLTRHYSGSTVAACAPRF